jgi:hypothetical protein
MRNQKGVNVMGITGIDFEKLAALFHDELHRTFSVRYQWYTCSDLFQQAWEQAITQALIQMASQEADEKGAASLLLERITMPQHPREPDFYTLAALTYEEIRKRYEADAPFFGLANAWERRTEKTHELWANAIRRALARTALSDEPPGDYDSYILHVERASADQPCVPPPRFVTGEGEPPPQPPERPT